WVINLIKYWIFIAPHPRAFPIRFSFCAVVGNRVVRSTTTPTHALVLISRLLFGETRQKLVLFAVDFCYRRNMLRRNGK
ncbi:unnamed protein product, partial [Allacma fusca]